METRKAKDIPALSYHRLTKYFDPLLKITMPEEKFKRELIKQANIMDGAKILDLGCGTATLSLLIKKEHPLSEVIGIDVDKEILSIASKKILESKQDIALINGRAENLPFTNCEFDLVLTSLMIHHLTLENKLKALKEAYRILKPGGELHIADFGKPHNVPMYLISLIMRWFEEVRDNIRGLLPSLIEQSGFIDVQEEKRYNTIFGTIVLIKAIKPIKEKGE